MSRRSRKCTRCGFTLVELVIVVLIIGILTVGAAPKFSVGLNRVRADAASLRIKADLNLARQTAITRSAEQSVVFTAGSAEYALPGLTDPDRPAAPYAVNLGDGSYRAVVTSAAFGAGTTVRFDRYGQPNSGGVVTVSAGGVTKTVSVDATSGAVSIP